LSKLAGGEPRRDQQRAFVSRDAGIIDIRKILKLLKFYADQDRRDSLNRPRPTIQRRAGMSENVHSGEKIARNRLES